MKLKSVMIVDDSEADQFYTDVIIRKHNQNIKVYQAYDGAEALLMLTKLNEPPCLILLDINMPNMNGFEFLDAYSTQDNISSAVMMLTSSDQPDDIEKSKQYKFVEKYIVKPIGLQNLKDLVS